jgi:hypothetical protein
MLGECCGDSVKEHPDSLRLAENVYVIEESEDAFAVKQGRRH